MYFAFLRTYASSLLFPAVLGVTFYFLDKPYHPAYAFGLLLYSTVFTEYWRVYERLFTSRFYPKGRFQTSTSLASMSTSSFTREKAERTHNPGIAWWKRDLRILASFPIISVFAGLLALLLTAIFVFEAFVTQLYTGPGRKLIVRCFPSPRTLPLLINFARHSVRRYFSSCLSLASSPSIIALLLR